MSGKQTDLEARLKRLYAEATKAEAGSATPQDALRLQMRGLIDNVDPHEDFMGALRVAVAAEHLNRIRAELDKRTGSELLTFAMGAAQGGYRQALRVLSSVGARRRQAERWPEPVVLFEPMATPMTLNRGGSAGLSFTGGRASALPFPLVFIPEYPDTSMGSLCVIQHEIGHNLDEDFGLTAAVEPLLERRLAHFNQQDLETWLAWTRELVADSFGLILAGTALVLELAEWARVLGEDAALASQTHPYPSVRVALAVEILKLLGVEIDDDVAPFLRSPDEDRSEYTIRLLKQAPEVATALVCSPIPRLNHVELRDLAPGIVEEGEIVLNVADDLVQNGSSSELQRVPYRLLPSVARIAVTRGADPEQIFATLVKNAPSRADAQAVRFREVIFTREALQDVEPPILDEENEGMKRPPANLFQAVRHVTFVGASNDGLPELFRKYATAGHPRKDRIDVVYLTEEAVRGLADGDRTASDLVQGRHRSLQDLTSELLDSVAVKWRVLEHDQPYLFGAYWDADRPRGRIHVSSHGWEQDIRYAPSVDYVWPEGAERPNRKYQWYLSARAGLMKRARVVAANF